MRPGDVVRVKLPHDESGGIPCLLVMVSPVSPDWKVAGGTDVWWEVIYDGKIKEVHQDYFREVISEVA